MSPAIGMRTAEVAKPSNAVASVVPACFPSKGGRMRFPAPKKNENSMKLSESV